MAKYTFLGNDTRTYMDIIIPGKGSLVVNPGDVVSFDEPPTDGQWALTPVRVAPLKMKDSEDK